MLKTINWMLSWFSARTAILVSVVVVVLVGGIALIRDYNLSLQEKAQAIQERIFPVTATQQVFLDELREYRKEKLRFTRAFTPGMALPKIDFYFFGMGSRTKYIYHQGALRAYPSGRTVGRWSVNEELIVPSLFSVWLRTKQGDEIIIKEDASGILITNLSTSTLKQEYQLAQGGLMKLPNFEAYRYPRIMRVLLQEILVNIKGRAPHANLFTYNQPHYRSAAMIAMALKETNNLVLVRRWIKELDAVYDSSSENQADNLGQVLYLLSLVKDTEHPLIANVQQEAERLRKGDYISGITSGKNYPMYQTQWLIFGLEQLGIAHNFSLPKEQDNLAHTSWWFGTNAKSESRLRYQMPAFPYLEWANAHFWGERFARLSNRDYPLTWGGVQGQYNYGFPAITRAYSSVNYAPTNAWHAAEALLYLLKEKKLESTSPGL